MHTSFVRSVAGALTALALFGCGGAGDEDPSTMEPDAGAKPAPGTAKFASWSAEERSQALSAAAGGGAALAMISVYFADFDAAAGECPQRTTVNDTIVYSAPGGCTTSSGVDYAGTVTAINPPQLDPAAHDPAKPMRAEFNQFARADESNAWVFDGLFVQTPALDGSYSVELDLTMGAVPNAISIDAGMRCEKAVDHTRCTPTDGSRGALSGRGTFVIRGELKTYSNGMSGWLELEGEDLLRLELEAGRRCNPMAIDGVAAGEICRAAPEPAPAAIEVTGASLDCLDDAYSTIATIKGEPDRVYVELASAGMSLEVDLAKGSVVEGTEEYFWSADIVPPQGISFGCSDYSKLGARVVAEKDGVTTCYVAKEGTEAPWSYSECQ